MSGGNQVPAGGPREARESLRGWLGRGLARPSVFLSEQRQALRHLVRLLTDVLANSQKKKCRDIPRGVLRTLRAKARACTGRVGRAGLSVFAGAQAQVREGGLHVLIVSFHERFHFRFLRSQGASRVRQRAPECNARLARNCLLPPIFPEISRPRLSPISNPWNAWNDGALLVWAPQCDFYRSSSKNPNRPLLMTEKEVVVVVRSIRSRVRQGAQDAKRSDRRRDEVTESRS